jgi:hypothetical protein
VNTLEISIFPNEQGRLARHRAKHQEQGVVGIETTLDQFDVRLC